MMTNTILNIDRQLIVVNDTVERDKLIKEYNQLQYYQEMGRKNSTYYK